MPSFRRAKVTAILSEREGLQRVRVDDARAYVLTQLTGSVAVGDDVIVNTTAVELGLGTGGWHVVHWNLARDAWSEAGAGHIMKLRYTSLQVDAGAGEEQHPNVPPSITGVPVVVGSLHSQVPAIAMAIKHLRPRARISYVMTDGAALPIAFSDLVVAMREQMLVDCTITAGHAFGGDLEAVTVPSALALARHVQAADAVIVAMGPGVVGTGTKLGTTALEVAPILDAAARLGGEPVMCLRVSSGDERARHQGISHHSLTALSLIHGPATIALAGIDPDGRALVEEATVGAPVRVVEVDGPDVAALLEARGLRVTTMGRGADEEPAFFAACAAAGAAAAALLEP